MASSSSVTELSNVETNNKTNEDTEKQMAPVKPPVVVPHGINASTTGAADLASSEAEDGNDNKKFTKLSEATEETEARVKSLAEMFANSSGTSFITYEARTIVWKINRCFVDWDRWRAEISKTLCKEKYPDLAISMMKRLFDVGPAADEATFKFSNNLLASLLTFANFNDFRQALGAAGIVPLFLDYVTDVQMYLEHIATKYPPEEYPSDKWTIAKTVILVLRQLAKDNNLKDLFTNTDALKIIAKLCSVDNTGVALASCCLFAFLANGSMLRSDFKDNYQKLLIDGLEHALEKHDSRNYCGIPARDIADALLLYMLKEEHVGDEVGVVGEIQKVKSVVDLIVGHDAMGRKYGSLLFRAFCGHVPQGLWIAPLIKFAKADDSKLDDVGREKAAKAVEFLSEYQTWARLDEDEPEDNAKKNAIEIEGFATKSNKAIKSTEDAKRETELRVKFLDKFLMLSPASLVTDVTISVYQLISASYSQCKPWRKEILDAAIVEGFPAIAIKYLCHCIKVGPVAKEETYDLMRAILGCFWSFTDTCVEMRLGLGKADAVQVMTDYMREASKKPNRSLKENHFIFEMVNVLYNMSRSVELKAEFLKQNVVDVLKEFINMSGLIKSVVILCLAHILSDTPEAAKFADDQGVVPTLVKYTESAMKHPERICAIIVTGVEVTSAYYSLEELVEGLALLAVNDAVKGALMQNNVCNIISFLLKCGSSNLESLGVDLLWTLSFEQKARKQISQSEEKLIDSLRHLVTSPDTAIEVRRNAAKALTFIEKWEEKVTTAEEESGRKSVTAKEGHIFISYSWKQQKTVMRIKEQLLRHNFTVWMDVERMHGDLLDAMAEAIEKASVVLICFSNTYRQSNPCRTEAQYAHALGKPIVPVNMEYHYFPDGWLGILVRSRKFVDMSFEKWTFEDAFQQLITELNAFTIESVEPKALAPPLGGGHSVGSSAVIQRTFETWSRDELQKWLARENLREFSKTLSEFDGKMLATLFSMKSTAPEFYFKSVSKHYDGPLPNVLRLLGVLDRLFSEKR